MDPFFDRRFALRAGLAATAAALLPRARACEYDGLTLRVHHPWTRATGPDAAVAVVCIRFEAITQPDRLIAVRSPVARGAQLLRAGMVQAVDLRIPVGDRYEIAEGDTQLRLVGLSAPLELARSYPMALEFEQGGVIEASLNVDYGPAA